MNEPKNYGYIKSKWDEKNYCLGGNKLPEEIINPDGDWTGSLPPDEPQQIGFDTSNCTGFGLTNALEIQHKFLYKEEINFSDRYLGIKAGTFPPGNNPQTVAEAARNGGLIPEAFLPFSPDLQNVNEYYSFKGGDKASCERAAREVQRSYKFGHDWLPKTGDKISKETLQYALQRGTVCVALYAWAERNGKYYRPEGAADTHWTGAVLLKIKENGEMVIYDSYFPFIKILEVGYPIYSAKRYYWRKKTQEEIELEEKQRSLIQQILEKIKQALILMGLLAKKIEEEKIETKPVESLPVVEPEKPKYEWGTKAQARLSVRRICDELELNWDEKNLITAVIQAESDFDSKKISPRNSNGTRDYGIAQFNDGKNAQGVPYWIGEGADFKDPIEVLNDPEKCVKVMLREHKRGNLRYWTAYKTGAYLKYML